MAKMIDGYVTKDELYRLISNIKFNPDMVVDDKTCSAIVKAISDMPTADVQPVKHGRWIITDDVEHFIALCSECGRTEDSRGIKDMPYCHCGAKMDIIYEDDKIRAIKVTGWDDDTRNLTDEETDIYNNRLEAEAKTINKISLL